MVTINPKSLNQISDIGSLQNPTSLNHKSEIQNVFTLTFAP